MSRLHSNMIALFDSIEIQDGEFCWILPLRDEFNTLRVSKIENIIIQHSQRNSKIVILCWRKSVFPSSISIKKSHI